MPAPTPEQLARLDIANITDDALRLIVWRHRDGGSLPSTELGAILAQAILNDRAKAKKSK